MPAILVYVEPCFGIGLPGSGAACGGGDGGMVAAFAAVDEDLRVAVHRTGMARGQGSTVFALPEAQQRLAAGMPGALNPPTA
jgi:hypothetical protein